MHDIKFIRQNPELFDAGMAKRGLSAQSAKILELDEKRRKSLTEIQELQKKKNELAKAVGLAKKNGENADVILAESKKVSEELTKLETETGEQGELEKLLATLPNIPADDVPVGEEEVANKEIRKWGNPPKLDFPAKQHFEIGEKLGLMDFESAAKISGARFVALKGQLAKMERALGNFMLDIHTKEFGYTEIAPPLLVRDNATYGTGQLPKFKDDLFSTNDTSYSHYFASMLKAQVKLGISIEQARNDENSFKKIEVEAAHIRETNRFWLIPTAEVALTNLVADSIIDEPKLPLRYTAFTPCFRSEAGAAGKDTRGMIRMHQFSKVELVSITKPEDSEQEHQRMTSIAEEVLKRLQLPYRVVLLSSVAGFSNKKTYDLEVWLPGQNAYREISSCSNCGDFQARRMKARFKKPGDKENRFVHTLNGSALAVGRTIVAILENYQNADGSVNIPDALQKYMDGEKVIK